MGRQPRLWLLMGHRAGDNSQLLALAEALGWPFDVKRFVYKKSELLTNLLMGANLAGVVRSRSSHLEAPWPDLVISAGRRNEPIARWVRARSGGCARLVHLGRPWARPDRFDLIVVTPQYSLPQLPNVLEIDLPLHQISASRLEAAAAQWRPRLAHLPRPYFAALIGGDSPPYRLDAGKAGRLGGEIMRMAEAEGGSVLMTTSARTSNGASAALHAALTGPAHFFRWGNDLEQNPYLGYLALADSIVVTGESVSMVTEACAIGKPVYIVDLGEGWSAMRPRDHPALQGAREPIAGPDIKALLHDLIERIGPRRMRRDVRVLLRRLVSTGRAAWLGDAPPRAPTATPPDLIRVTARVRALFEAGAPAR